MSENASDEASATGKHLITIQRDNTGELRPVDTEGRLAVTPDFIEEHCIMRSIAWQEAIAEHASRQDLPPVEEEHIADAPPIDSTINEIRVEFGSAMTALHGAQMIVDDLTQKSSMPMSPTQENPESAYKRFNKYEINRDGCSDGFGTVENDGQSLHERAQDSLGTRKQHSAFTDSTAHTYGENDTGHVQFDAIILEDSAEYDEPSQDTSFAPRKENPYGKSSYEPQTPAPPVNPFSHKGSVMKGHEMFGATQPSSIGRHIASATSTRPSPDIYNNFTSPVKHMPSSPLPGRVDQEQTSPLMSSVRDLLRPRSILSSEQNVTVPRTSGVQSFDAGPWIPLQNREPRAYVSMQESQERRRREEDATLDADSDTDLDDFDDVPRKRLLKQQREREIAKELSAIGVSTRPNAIRQVSSGSGFVEIPSTGRKLRRRSTQEEYLAQCEGRDARDSQSQQEDVITDSQSVPVNSEVSAKANNTSEVMPSWTGTNRSGSDKSNIPASPMLPGPAKRDNDHESLAGVMEGPPIGQNSSVAEQSLPLQEVSTNRNDVRTPSGSKNQLYSDVDSTVPETSPPEDRLLPMGEIANISFGDTQNDFTDLPGFSQIDHGFEDAIREPSSPELLARKRNASRNSKSTRGLKVLGAEVASELITSTRAAASDLPIALLLEHLPSQPAPTVTESTYAAVGVDRSLPVEHASHHDEEAGKVVDEVELENEDGKNGGPVKEATADGLPLPNLRKASLRRNAPKAKAESIGSTKNLRISSGRTPKPLVTYTTPRQPLRVMKSSVTTVASTGRSSKRDNTPGIMSTPLSSLPTISTPGTRSSPARPSTSKSINKQAPSKDKTPIPKSTKPQTTRRSGSRAKNSTLPIAALALSTKSSKRKSIATPANLPVHSTRSFKRQSMAKSTRDSSVDPLVAASPAVSRALQATNAPGLFENMAFAVSYVDPNEERDEVTRLIMEHNGKILADGFDELFDLKPGAQMHDGHHGLPLSPAATRVGFTALIADEHSRKAKYMQALALGLPCISGRWIRSCVSSGALVKWAPYLLCAGQPSFLGNAIRSRILQPYPAQDASFTDTITSRDKLLEGKSVLLVTGKGRGAEDKRKAYVFLTRALGPAQLEQVVDYEQARKRLLETEGEGPAWDLLYVDNNIPAAEAAVFGSTPPQSSFSRKRKRGPTAAERIATPVPKKIRIISDEDVIQSLILGELLD